MNPADPALLQRLRAMGYGGGSAPTNPYGNLAPAPPPPPDGGDTLTIPTQTISAPAMSATDRLKALGQVPAAPSTAPEMPIGQKAIQRLANYRAQGKISDAAYDSMKSQSPQGIMAALDRTDAHLATQTPESQPAPTEAKGAVINATQPGAGSDGSGGAPSTIQIPGGQGGATAGGFASTISPEARALSEKALGEGEVAGQSQIAAERGVNEAAGNAALNQAGVASAQTSDMNRAEADRRTALEHHERELEGLRKDAENGQVDPDRRWNSRDAGHKALGLISLFLHGLSGKAGPSIIEQQAAADIDAQKANIANKWHGVQAKESLLGRMMARFGDERVAEAAARSMEMQHYAALARSEAAKAQSPLFDARAKALQATADAKYADFVRGSEAYVKGGGAGIDWQKKAADYAEQQAQKAREKSLPVDDESIQKWKGEYLRIHATDKAQMGVAPILPGAAGGAQEEKDNDALTAAQEVLKGNAEITRLMSKPGALSIPERTRMEQIGTNLALHYPRMQTGSSRINESELEAGKATYAGTHDWYKGDPLGRQRARLAVISQQAQDRISEIQARKKKGGNAAPAAGPAPSSFLSQGD